MAKKITYSVFDSAYPAPMGINYSKRRAVAMTSRIKEVFNRPAFITITTPAINREQNALIQQIKNFHQSKDE